MKLYEISWGIYPRRVGVYLAEKGITDIERIDIVPKEVGPPILGDLTIPGSVPALDTGDGHIIGSSIAVLEYLEERYPTPNLLGETAIERAKTREVVSVIDEATIHYGNWVHHVSPLFADHVKQNAHVGAAGNASFVRFTQRLEKYAAASPGPFLVGENVTIADCITFSALQFMKEVYSVPMPDDCPTLEKWYAMFSERPSARKPDYPPFVLEITRGLPEQTAAALASS